ncbi:MAG TPA: WYL domain-containing protein [Acidimicrobiia bacterium]|nr:WYL domain-containing protein [Acidimicrobiia bacterium]
MADDATERILRLAAYLADRGRTSVTLGTISADVPGYGGDDDPPRDERGELVVDTREWETIRKRLQRDLKVLDDTLGIEVETTDDGYRLRPPFFTPDERRALIAAAAAVDVEGVDDEPVLGELGTAVDASTRRIVLAVPERVRELSAAIRERAPVTFTYHGRARTVDAYALGRWRTHWYVVGREHDADAIRKYRLDRIETASGALDVTVGEPGSYTVPASFDATEQLRLDPNDWGQDPPVAARIEVSPDHVHNFQYELGGRVRDRADTHVVVEVEVRHYESFRERVLRFGEHARVVGPPELVTLVRDHLHAVVEATR